MRKKLSSAVVYAEPASSPPKKPIATLRRWSPDPAKERDQRRTIHFADPTVEGRLYHFCALYTIKKAPWL
jgi:hypothetical protein